MLEKQQKNVKKTNQKINSNMYPLTEVIDPLDQLELGGRVSLVIAVINSYTS